MVSRDMVKRQKSLFDEMSDEEYLKVELKKLRQQELINREKQAQIKYSEEFVKYYQIPADLAEPYLISGREKMFYEVFFKVADEVNKKDRLSRNNRDADSIKKEISLKVNKILEKIEREMRNN